ncbi:hypothetical protein UFOVP1613_8 [uncultured Caudovirales phage]|uniref:Uncharacterized protein n=1 Tax=uncultured Caudovirales phage TaxID=2100421 RepID=A0A6J5QRW3_9CAUD|nr:hypothetical protein UFOVP1163_10 [uncultured Caudovirales phage]CAB4219247.1 hypothetical protein UFOVP1613_8 [uncultured Caudovirales phage]
MTLSKKLGKQFQQVKDEIQIKKITIDLGEVKFDLKMKVPLKKEMEDINAKILTPAKEKIDDVFERLSGPMRKTLEEGGEEFVKALNESKQTITITDDDIIVDGTSLRQVAQYQAIEETRVEEYFHLLISETGEAINESFEQISAEFPDFAIKEIVQSIQSTISPDYKSAKKN